MVKSHRSATVAGVIPAPLSLTVTNVISSSVRVAMSMTGALPAVSAASSALSSSSLTTTCPNASAGCPVCACSARSSRNSAARGVENTVRFTVGR